MRTATREVVKTTTVGWRGISLRVPEDWSLTSVSGEGPNGYLRVEGPESLFLQVKWWEKRGLVSVPDALDSYIADLRKKAKKLRRGLELKTRPKGLTNRRPSEQAALTYTWQADQRAYGMVWHCSECRRLVIAEVVGRLEDDFSVATELLNSIREHGEGGWTTWGMYGLALQIPDAYQIEKHRLMTGYLEFTFRSRARTLRAERWGLANVILKDAPLRDWFEYQARNRLGRYTYRCEETEVNGHPAIHLVGRERFFPAISRAVQQITALSRPALRFEALVWQCPDTNKVIALTSQHPGGDRTLWEVVDRLSCHSEA
jgi:ribosomal protein L34E